MSYSEILGRDGLNDLDAILAITNTDVNEVVHAVKDNADAIFTWDYERSRPNLGRLYEKAKTSQWNGETDLDWSVDVDQEKLAREMGQITMPDPSILPEAFHSSPMAKWGEKEWIEVGIHQQNWMLSQFMHGEQGALVCTAKIVETVPWIDAKYYASTQVMDEARHVEVFAKYLDTKLSGHFPINAHLKMLLDDIIADSRWDMTYLGMQIMVEGLALAAFGMMQQITPEPLLKQLLRYVMSDEARHVAFGVLSLHGVLRGAVRRRDEGPPGVRVRSRRPHARPLPAAGGVGSDGRRPEGRHQGDAGRRGAGGRPVPAAAVRQDRPELQEARAARRQQRLAA